MNFAFTVFGELRMDAISSIKNGSLLLNQFAKFEDSKNPKGKKSKQMIRSVGKRFWGIFKQFFLVRAILALFYGLCLLLEVGVWGLQKAYELLKKLSKKLLKIVPKPPSPFFRTLLSVFVFLFWFCSFSFFG
jgi:hypothetical protein